MSTREDNIALALRYLKHIELGEHDEAFALATDDAVFFLPGVGEIIVEELRPVYAQIKEKFAENPRYNIRGIAADGDRVAVEFSGDTLMKTGLTYHNDYHFLFVVRDGKLAQLKEYADSAPAQVHFFGDD